MNEEKARRILADLIDSGELGTLDDEIYLEGWYDLAYFQSLVWWMENKS